MQLRYFPFELGDGDILPFEINKKLKKLFIGHILVFSIKFRQFELSLSFLSHELVDPTSKHK